MTSCKKQTSQRYKTRKSPSYSAQDCKGKTLKGKDGLYVSKPDKNNVYKWVKKASGAQTKRIKGKRQFTMLDNGGYPFVVLDHGGSVDIYKRDFDYDTHEDHTFESKKLKELNYTKLFVGKPHPDKNNENSYNTLALNGKAKGNSLLLEHNDGTYTYVGIDVKTFKPVDGEKILKYYSPIGVSAVPYPYAVGEKYTYLVSFEDVYIPNSELDLKEDVYMQYYARKKAKDNLAKPIQFKTLVKRVF